ncbi:MAG: YHYH protein [Haliea sp.]|uniref:YHYH protein n=1 Tax=Haliea sp. TaxID=1932666 RepID=UPI0032EE279A
MTILTTHCRALLLGALLALTSACGSSNGSSGDSTTATATTDTSTDAGDDTTTTSREGMDIDLFQDGALASEITTVSCTLSGGTQTTCYRIEIAGTPAAREIGPFCPPSIYSEADEGGIWFDGSGTVWDIDGEFITNLGNIYGDSNWLLYDTASGEVNVTDTQIACEAAARPNVDPEYQNHCVQCSLDYYGGGVAQTVLIPTAPVPLSSPASLNNGDLGIALDGVILAPPAPVQAILAAYTIAAFDDCGGHVNPVEGYHYHASVGCAERGYDDDGHSGVMAYALDGYAIYGMSYADGSEPDDLDACRGHTELERGYHYHAASAAENMFIGCFSGEQGSVQ